MKGELTFMDKLQEILGKVSIKLSGNLYINAIKDGMLAYMPFAFIASIFLIIAFFPIPAFTDFVSSITGLEAAVWQGKLALVNDASLGIGGLLVLLSISRSLADKLGINGIVSILISYVAFATGLVPVCTGLAQVPWTTPLVISGYLATGSIAGSILQIVCLIVVVLIWLPFVRIADNQLIKEEAALENKGGSVQETI